MRKLFRILATSLAFIVSLPSSYGAANSNDQRKREDLIFKAFSRSDFGAVGHLISRFKQKTDRDFLNRKLGKAAKNSFRLTYDASKLTIEFGAERVSLDVEDASRGIFRFGKQKITFDPNESAEKAVAKLEGILNGPRTAGLFVQPASALIPVVVVVVYISVGVTAEIACLTQNINSFANCTLISGAWPIAAGVVWAGTMIYLIEEAMDFQEKTGLLGGGGKFDLTDLTCPDEFRVTKQSSQSLRGPRHNSVLRAKVQGAEGKEVTVEIHYRNGSPTEIVYKSATGESKKLKFSGADSRSADLMLAKDGATQLYEVCRGEDSRIALYRYLVAKRSLPTVEPGVDSNGITMQIRRAPNQMPKKESEEDGK